MRRVGIEKCNLYGCSMFLDQRKLAIARDQEPDKVVSDFLINTRSLNPLFEDTVTMGANAARPILASEDIESIGLFVVGTESSLDFGKPISTNLHEALGLPPNVRNFEVKHACYCGVAALDTAVNWIASGLNQGRKALVISSDYSRMHLNLKEEFVLGGVAAAALISDQPRILELETEKKGTWTTNAYDTYRPSARHEMGNNEVSLYTYLDALEGAYQDYLNRNPDNVDFDEYFTYNVYHTPFPGMAFQAHRTLCNLTQRRSKSEVRESFDQKVFPGLRFARRVGSTYGASNFIAILSLAAGDPAPKEGERVGLFSYGSGAIGEFYSGIFQGDAGKAVHSLGIDQVLDTRHEVTVPEYEEIEEKRESLIEERSFQPDLSLDLFKDLYQGKDRLVLKEVKDFIRTYEWS